MALSSSVPVLGYHGVGSEEEDRFAVSLPRFQEQVDAFARRYQIVNAATACRWWREKGGFPRDLLVITFDDGYRDFLQTLPLLERAGASVTVFVSADHVGNDNQWDPHAVVRRCHLDPEELRICVSAGHDIGSHGLSHQDLLSLPADRARNEVAQSRHILEGIICRPVTTVAYPFGSANADVAAWASHNYLAGFMAGKKGYADWSIDAYRIQRIMVRTGDSSESLLRKIDGYGKDRASN